MVVNEIDSDDEYFESDDHAIQRQPFSLLGDISLCNTSFRRELLNHPRELFRGCPEFDISLLNVVGMYLIKRPAFDYPVSNHDFMNCKLRRIQQCDYLYESSWSLYLDDVQREWLYNATTGEWFYTDETSEWQAYRDPWSRAVWRLNGRRWFWQHTSADF